MKRLEELTLADDFIFSRVMSKIDNAKEFLEGVFNRKIKDLRLVSTQSSFKESYDAHGTRFDVEFSGNNTVYDIEMQTTGSNTAASRRELLRRSRYYHANIATRYLSLGQKYTKLPDSFVIFICTFDPFSKGLAMYTQCPAIKELNSLVTDGTTTLYLNAEYSHCNTTHTVENFLRYIYDPKQVHLIGDEYISKIHRDVEFLKLDANVRRDFMSFAEKLQIEREEGIEEGIEKGRVEGRAKGRAEGREEGLNEALQKLIESGFSEKEARRLLQLPTDKGDNNLSKMKLT